MKLSSSGLRRWPHLDRWFDAMESRETYLGLKSDFYTHVHDLPPQLGGALCCGCESVCMSLLPLLDKTRSSAAPQLLRMCRLRVHPGGGRDGCRHRRHRRPIMAPAAAAADAHLPGAACAWCAHFNFKICMDERT